MREEKVRLDPRPNDPKIREENSESDGTMSSSDEDGEGEDPVSYKEMPVNEMIGSPPVKIGDDCQVSMDCKEIGDDVAVPLSEAREGSERDVASCEDGVISGDVEAVRVPAVFIPLQRDPDVQVCV